MKNNITCMNIVLETVGPVFIGKGGKYQKSEYILDTAGKMFYVMDTLEMYNGLKKTGMLSTYEKWVLSQPANVNLFNFVRDNNISPGTYGKWARYRFPVSNIAELAQKNSEIMPFMKDAYNLPYVPGSSLKGALRNAVLNSELLRMKDKKLEDSVERAARNYNGRRNTYLRKEAADIDVRLFHTLGRVDEKGREVDPKNAVNSVFQGLRVSDSKPLPIDSLGLYRKTDVLPDGEVSSPPLTRECIRPGIKIEFTAWIDRDIFPYGPEDIARCVQDMYRSEREKFLKYFPKTQQYAGNMIYIGGGAGFVSKTAVYSLFGEQKRAVECASVILDNTDSVKKGKKTGEHLSDPEKYGVAPHTRKDAKFKEQRYELGLCRLTFSEENA